LAESRLEADSLIVGCAMGPDGDRIIHARNAADTWFIIG